MKKILLLFTLGIISLCFAEPLPFSQILNLATKASAETSFKAVMTTLSDENYTRFVYYQQVNPDGSVYKLMKPLDKNVPMSFVTNEKGSFDLIGSTAIRTDRLQTPVVSSPMIPVRKDENTFILNGKEFTRQMVGDKNFATLDEMSKNGGLLNRSNQQGTVRDVTHNGRFCYYVKFHYQTDDGRYTSERIIDKENFFTYQTKTFTPSGKCTISIAYSDIEINPVIDPGLFALPQGTKIVSAKTETERIMEVSAASDKINPPRTGKSSSNALSGWFGSFFTKASTLFWNHTTNLSYLFALLAGIILVLAVFMKVKNRNKFGKNRR